MPTATLAASAAVFSLLLSAPPPTRRLENEVYPLTEWEGRCGAKGRFQDREYCRSSVIDLVVADGATAIPALIRQITDEPS